MPLQTDSILFDVLSADPGSPVEGQMWFNTTDKTLKVFRTTGGTSAVQARVNVTTTDPLVTSDSASGYAVGSRWINNSTDEEFVCCESTVGAAVWRSTTSSSGSSVLVKTASASVVADTTSNSTAWATLLTLNITTGIGFLLIHCTAGFSATNATARRMAMRVTVDGVSVGAVSSASASTTIAEAFAIAARYAVTAGAHVVLVEWQVVSPYSVRCRPLNSPNDEHCNLVVQEVTA